MDEKRALIISNQLCGAENGYKNYLARFAPFFFMVNRFEAVVLMSFVDQEFFALFAFLDTLASLEFFTPPQINRG